MTLFEISIDFRIMIYNSKILKTVKITWNFHTLLKRVKCLCFKNFTGFRKYIEL